MAEWEPLVIVAGEGAYLVDEAGRRYLDGVSSLWANVHGHRRRELDDAVKAQLERIAHSTLLGLSHPPAVRLAERLAALAAPLSRVFYSDSGSTAVEVALKMAFQCQQQRGQTQRQKFLALEHAYHGDTLGAVSVGGIELFHRLFSPLLFATLRCAPELDALEHTFAEHGPSLCALVIEPLLQGAAGMRLHPAGLLQKARELCDRHGVLLIADEVATGFGRTGTMFACEQEQVVPDFLCLAKGLTGGYLPLAATLTHETIFEAFLGRQIDKRTFFHGHTYTGNPLACAAALASIELLCGDGTSSLSALPKKIARLGARLAAELGAQPHVRQIRQRGLMVGIELGESPDVPYEEALGIGRKVCQRVRDYGVILRPLGDVIVLMPPFCIEEAELELLVAATRRAIVDVCGA
jgi:adenosylmethionine-8-amino-7-oxononanoate aminotransferase